MAYTSKYTGKQIDERLDHMVNVTWEELKAQRDNGKLIAGQMYRMTDYETMTMAENTKAAGHPFDLILTALDEKTLDEKCSAIVSERDTEGYFANSNLPAWQIWYTIDNDKNKGHWAAVKGANVTLDLAVITGTEGYATASYSGTTFDYDGTTYYRFDVTIMDIPCYLLTTTEIPSAGDTAILYAIYEGAGMDGVPIYSVSVNEEGGKGVIYRMIDEKRNDVPYDFKNILFKYKDTDYYLYTFTKTSQQAIDTSVISDSVHSNVFGRGCFRNIFLDISTFSNTFGNECYGNTFGRDCYSNTFGKNCHSNTFGVECFGNTFGDYCHSNTFGNYCHSNTFKARCYDNTFGNYCNLNTFGSERTSGSFESSCHSNVFGSGCYSNTFMDSCYSNTFASSCFANTFKYSCYNNTFKYYCHSNTLKARCYDNTFGENCHSNTFGVECFGNTFGDYCHSNTFGNRCHYNTFGELEIEFYCNSIRLADNNKYITLSGTGTSSSYLQDYEFNLTYGTNSAPIEYTLEAGRTITTYVINNGGTPVEYTALDLYNLINA